MSQIIEIEKAALRNGLIRKFREAARIGALEIFLTLYAFSKDDMIVQVRRQDLAKATGYSEYKIRQTLVDMERAGFIERMNPNVRRVPMIYALKLDV